MSLRDILYVGAGKNPIIVGNAGPTIRRASAHDWSKVLCFPYLWVTHHDARISVWVTDRPAVLPDAMFPGLVEPLISMAPMPTRSVHTRTKRWGRIPHNSDNALWMEWASRVGLPGIPRGRHPHTWRVIPPFHGILFTAVLEIPHANPDRT